MLFQSFLVIDFVYEIAFKLTKTWILAPFLQKIYKSSIQKVHLNLLEETHKIFQIQQKWHLQI